MSNLTRRATTIVCVRRNGEVAMAGDGQVTLGDTIAKANAVKVRKIDGLGANNAGVLAGFAGGAADGFALLERFEATLKATPTNLMKASIDLARQWRTDRALRRLEALMIVADRDATLMLSGQGDVIEPADGICTIGSGGTAALAAARALMSRTELISSEICKASPEIAAEICIYTNQSVVLETL